MPQILQYVLIGLGVLWLYYGICLAVIARKTGCSGGILAFIPGLDLLLMCRIAEKSVIWFFLMIFIAPISPFIACYLFASVARSRGKTGLFCLPMLLPIFNLMAWTYLAYSDTEDRGKDVFNMILLLFLITLIGVFFFFKTGSGPVHEYVMGYVKQIEEKVVTAYSEAKDNYEKGQQDSLLLKDDVFYHWVDAKGADHWVMTLEEVPEAYRGQVKKIGSAGLGDGFQLMSREEEGQAINSLQGTPVPESMKAMDHRIILYTYEGNRHLEETVVYLEKFNLPYEKVDVVADPQKAAELKKKLGLDINKKYSNLVFPILDINGKMVERIITETDGDGNVLKTKLNTAKIRKLFGLRETF